MSAALSIDRFVRGGARRLLALGALLLVECGSSPAMLAIADDYAKQSGLTFAVCGSAQLDNGSICTPTAVDDCLATAFASCTPSRASLTAYSVEGDPISYEIFVEMTTGGCRVVQIVDTRQDAFGPQEVVRSSCTGTTVLQCFSAWPSDCTVVEKY